MEMVDTATLGTVVISVDPFEIVVWVVIGLVVGFVASRVMLGHGLGIVGDVAVGLVGAVIGGVLTVLFGVSFSVPGHPVIAQAIVAFLGAVLLLGLLRLAGAGRRRARLLRR